MEFSFKDTYRAAIEFLSDGANTVMYDEYGNPNIMVCVPKYTLEMIRLSGGTHTAFLCEGKEVNEFWISKYSNSLGNGGVPVSIPDANPISMTSMNKARTGCLKKGRGWHQMTVYEYGAIVQLEHERGGGFYGRYYGSNAGKDSVAYPSTEIEAENDSDRDVHRSGTGDDSWGYEGAHGVFDLVGNTHELCDGMRVASKTGAIEFFGDGKQGSFANNFLSAKYVNSWWAYDITGGNIYVDNQDVDMVNPDVTVDTFKVVKFSDLQPPTILNGDKDSDKALDMRFLQSLVLFPKTDSGVCNPFILTLQIILLIFAMVNRRMSITIFAEVDVLQIKDRCALVDLH